MQFVKTSDKTKLFVKDWGSGRRMKYEGAPHGLFATYKRKLTRDLLDFIRR